MSDVVIPENWCTATIMDVATASGGGTPSKSDSSFWDAGTIPWVSPKDMKTFLIQSSEDLVSSKALGRLTLIPSDSILVVVRSGILSRTLPVSINKVPVTINQDMRAFVPEAGIDHRYIAWQLVSQERSILDRCSKDGTTVASIEGPALANYQLTIAPEKEQTRIVEKLEELLSELDAGVAELKAAQRKLAQYRQSLLKAAVEGSLTADWRAAEARRGEPQETGAELLQRILTERRARWEAKQLAKFAEQGVAPPKGWQSKYPEPTAPGTDALTKLPKDWIWSSIGQCFHVAVGATPSRKVSAYWNGDIPWVSSGEVCFNRITSTKEQITNNGLSNTSTQINPAGSVLLGMIGEGKTRGQVAILDIPATNNQNCAAIWVTNTGIPSEYVYYWLWSRYDETRRVSSGNNQPALNKSVVESIPFPLPPLAEVKEIVFLLETALVQINLQDQAIERSLKQAAAQRKNILKAAFSGKLVPQNPNDEPASILLERIRTERAARGDIGRQRAHKAKEAV